MIWLLIFLLFGFAGAVDLQNDVDYWNMSHIKNNKRIEKKIEKKETFKSGEEILEASIKWYENKVKKEKPLIEYLYFKNPEKYASLMREWIKWKNKKTAKLMKYQIIEARPERINPALIIKELNKRGYEILYFYSNTCKFCKFTKPEMKNLGAEIPVYWIEIHKEPEMFKKWNVSSTPTVIFVSPKEKKAVRWKGAFTRIELLNYIYKVIKNEITPYSFANNN